MFFILSKTVGRLADPAFLALTCLSTAVLLGWAGRWAPLRRALRGFGLAVLLLFALDGFACALLYPLETAYVRPARLARAPAAIVVLGGMLESDQRGGSYYELSGAADRIVEGLRLARRYPHAVLLISGGSSALHGPSNAEAPALGRLVQELGLPRQRLRIDERARNTHENAVNTIKLIGDLRGPVLLVTSASHMLRSVACFAKAGRRVVPWPVDYYRARLDRLTSWIPHPRGLEHSAIALREYIGLLAYRAAGYI